MESGEKELRKAFEEVSNRNIKAVLEHSNQTRKMINELKDQVNNFQETLRNFEQKLNEIRKLLTNVQQKIYSGGT